MVKNSLTRKTVQSPSLDFKNRLVQQLLGVMQVQLIPAISWMIPWGLLSSCFCMTTWLSDCRESYEYGMTVQNRKMDQVANLTGKTSLLTVVDLNRKNHSHSESKSNLAHSWQMNIQTLLLRNFDAISPSWKFENRWVSQSVRVY